MPEFKFKPATPYPIKYSTNERSQEFEDTEKYPRGMSLFIPVESVAGFCDHLMKLVDTKTTEGKVWDYSQNKEVEVEGIYINAKGKVGKYGDFGNINLNFIEPKEVDEIPF